MTKHHMIIAISAALSSVPALADDITITTGYAGGSYHNVLGNNLGQILGERGHDVTLQESAGSIENIERVASGDAQLGFAQADAVAFWSDRNAGANVQIIGSLGSECVYIAAGEHSGIDDEDDLEEGVKIAVGDQGSGSAVSWQYLQQLEDDYQETSTYFRGGVLAMSQVKGGQLDAFLWVTSPENLDHKYLRAALADGSGMKLIDVDDYSLNEELPNGEQVYEFRDVVVKEGTFSDTEVEVPCTSVLVIASETASGTVLEDVATAVMMNSNRIQGK